MNTSPAHFLNMLKFSTGLDALSLTSLPSVGGVLSSMSTDKYSSIPLRVVRGPFRGPGTAAWQRQQYGLRTSTPDAFQIDNRARFYLPRNAPFKDVEAAYDAKNAPAENRAFAGLLAGVTGLGAGTLGLAGYGAMKYVTSPEMLALREAYAETPPGFKFVPDR